MNDIHTISGIVIEGENYGEKLGYPTANINISENVEEIEAIPEGVYAGITERENGDTLESAIVISRSKNNKNPKVESHILNFKDNVYGEKLTLHLKKFIREFKNYTEEADLKKQIKQDIEQISNLTL